MRRYCQSKILFYSGKIARFVLQPRFVFQEGSSEEKAITYSSDFLVLNNDRTYEAQGY
ncbi:Hypothetical protein CLAU_1055 [Clostridium autoethanogenum DSM 10061]|uniref:DUF1064 domain-containing protein n=1 Tax=Clostridium autoethanogenum DSM 10061 TaxID=1341692 RepID=A0ABN4BHM3_9CLOT|nr:DUF1064 domain-containing protein [Clostridium autoethanogenum DSM 10061]ALU35484.1 Hypothetical protein CLAU_1055 [Clostridium autoethanogenum DSM 10061]OVY48557.1 hypothetical protein WX72_00505 [Clostridium autoethanogenum]